MSSHTLNNRRKLTKAVSSKDLKAFKAAKKRELSKLDSKMKVLHLSPPSTQLQVPICKSFNGGFFNIKSPVRPSSPPEAPPCSPKQRNRFDSSKSNEFLRQAVLTTSSIKNPTSPYMVMKVSSVGKRDLRIRPGVFLGSCDYKLEKIIIKYRDFLYPSFFPEGQKCAFPLQPGQYGGEIAKITLPEISDE
ncbi:unnamed protein product [Lepeophtheirus salmonis]|uniref:(salmon louse) hypothetical protein n=1 Tax=Lepeophtheirus salmonis TaxID=72036 RepID=A0A7R8CDL5_LEPSM|nr:unnamed protein product [Lepeophtheirus salmonis]CAF2778143.1 unnamed protein product [Lepeophtheirus salmonis]